MCLCTRIEVGFLYQQKNDIAIVQEHYYFIINKVVLVQSTERLSQFSKGDNYEE